MRNHETHQPKPETLRRKLRTATAILAGAAAFTGFSEAAYADTPPSTDNITPTKVEAPKNLRNLSEVAQGKTINPEVVQAHQEATLELLVRPKNADGSPSTAPWRPESTGVLIKMGGKEYLFTASHVVSDTTGVFDGSIVSQDPSVEALDYTSRAVLEYAVADPTTKLSYRRTHPIGIVDQIDVAADGTDIAALRIVDSGIKQSQGRSLDEVKPLKYKQASKAPKLGSPVSLNGIPMASGFKPLAAQGIYLTRETYTPSSNPTTTLWRDVVAVEAPSPDKDVCNYGASGELVQDQNGSALGVLSARDNIGYGPSKTMQDIEHNYIQHFKDYRAQLEQTLRVKLPSKYTICMVSIPKPGEISALQHATPVPKL